MTNQSTTSLNTSIQNSNSEISQESMIELAKKDLSEIVTTAQLRIILATNQMHDETVTMLAEVLEHLVL